MVDIRQLCDDFPNQYAEYMGKGYRGVAEVVYILISKKNSNYGRLTTEKELTSRNISSDRTIVENWIGRLKFLWVGKGAKQRCKEAHYDAVFNVYCIKQCLHSNALVTFRRLCTPSYCQEQALCHWRSVE